MVLLLSDTAAWWIAIGIVTVIGGLIGLITLNGDMKAFDLIPEKIFGENHKKVVKGQRGKKLFCILAFLMVTVGCIGQTKPRPEIHLESESFTYYKEYAVGYSLSIRRSIYGKVRIVTDSKEKADLRVYRAKKGEVHKFDIRIVDHEPNKGEWKIVTRKGDEDFTICFTDVFEADVSIQVLE